MTTSKETSDEDSGSNSFEQWSEKVEYEGEVYGLYATYDYVFPNSGGLYAKGRLGIAKNKAEFTLKGTYTNSIGDSESDNLKAKISDTGLAGGLGLGYNIAPNAAIELAYEWYPEVDDTDINGITLGANFKF